MFNSIRDTNERIICVIDVVIIEAVGAVTGGPVVLEMLEEGLGRMVEAGGTTWEAAVGAGREGPAADDAEGAFEEGSTEGCAGREGAVWAAGKEGATFGR